MTTKTLVALALLAVICAPAPAGAEPRPFGFAVRDQGGCYIEAENVPVEAVYELCMLEGTRVTLDQNARVQRPVRRLAAAVQRDIIEDRRAVPGHYRRFLREVRPILGRENTAIVERNVAEVLRNYRP